MIAVLRSELFRTLTLRSSWVSMLGSTALGVAFAWFSSEFWTLFAGLGAFGVAVVVTGQHYQHRTAVLLFLGQPNRLLALAAQCVSAALIAIVLAAISGLALFSSGELAQYRATLTAIPLMAVFGVANATVVRRPTWLFAGYAGWLLFMEGMIGQLESPWPFTTYLLGSAGDLKNLMFFAGWTVAALVAAVFSIRRDLTGD